MKENKIMIENQKNFDRDGFLGYEYIKKYFYDKKRSFFGSVETSAGRYIIEGVDMKDLSDSEILFSQIYSKAGFKVPIYFMSRFEKGNVEKNFLICDDVATDSKSYYNAFHAPYNISMVIEDDEMQDNTILARDYHQIKTDELINSELVLDFNEISPLRIITRYRILKEIQNNNHSILSPLDPLFCGYFEGEKNPIIDYFSKKAVQQRIKMSILDAATFNSTRIPTNYLYKLNMYKKVEEVMPLNSGNTFINARLAANGRYSEIDKTTFNDYTFDEINPIDILKNVERNDEVKEYFSDSERKEFGRQLQDIAHSNIAEDVKSSIGYEVDKDFNNAIMKNLDDAGIMLEHGIN